MKSFLKNLQNYLIVFFALLSVVIIVIGINRMKKTPSLGDRGATPPSPPSPDGKPVAGAKATDGSFTGNIYQTPYGNVVAGINVKGGKIVGVTMPKVPNSPPSLYAQPYLVDQALKAGGANIQGVSGATYTSIAFKSSLESAIAKAGVPSPSGNTVKTTTPSVPRSYRGDDNGWGDD